MGQPNPPGDNVPLYEGLDPSWNDIVGAFPEDKRAELAPLLKERISGYETQLDSYKPWADLQKSGITPDFAGTAVQLFTTIENNPREVYETIGKHLGITTAEVKEVAESLEEEGQSDDPRLATLQQQVETMTQIMLAQRHQNTKEQLVAEQESALEKSITDLKQKYGNDINEEQILMRMMHKDMSAEDAYQEYSNMVSEIRKTRPAPMVMGTGGTVPNRAIDPAKLDGKSTRNLVAQMLDHANYQNNQ